MIEIEINTRDLNSVLELLESKLANRRSLMADLARILNNAVDDNFAAGGRPSWAPLKYPRPRGGGKPLQDTGRLRNSMVSQSDNNQKAWSGSDGIIYPIYFRTEQPTPSPVGEG